MLNAKNTATDTTPSLDVDPFSPEFLADPYTFYETLRAVGSVVYLPKYQCYAVVGFNEAETVLNDWQTFSSASGTGLKNFKYEEPELFPQNIILEVDPPQHGDTRGVLEDVFNKANMDDMARTFTETANQLVTSLMGRDSFDAVTELAQPLHLIGFGDIIGLEEDERENLIPLTNSAFNEFGAYNDIVEDSRAGLMGPVSWALGVSLRSALTPDRLGDKIYAHSDSGVITEEEAATLIRSVLTGSYNTIHSLADVVHCLSNSPEQWRLLKQGADDPELIERVTDEVLRYCSPLQTYFRTTTKEIELGGVVIPEDSKVQLFLGAANRDPNRWPDPNQFNIERNVEKHLAFGRGPHACVGRQIARVELAALIRALAKHAGCLVPMGEPSYHRNNMLRGLESLKLSPKTEVDSKIAPEREGELNGVAQRASVYAASTPTDIQPVQSHNSHDTTLVRQTDRLNSAPLSPAALAQPSDSGEPIQNVNTDIVHDIMLKLIQQSGIATGMQVLDIGTGSGYSALALARAVGSTGSVVSIDINPATVDRAKAIADRQGITNIQFITGTLSAPSLSGLAFDALFGRQVLMYQQPFFNQSPSDLLRSARALVKPAGIVAFLEPDLSNGFRSYPAFSYHQQLVSWLTQTFDGANFDRQMGLNLCNIFQDGGLNAPELSHQITIGSGEHWHGYKYYQETLTNLLPLMEKLNIASASELDADCIAERLRREAIANKSTVMASAWVSAWVKTPIDNPTREHPKVSTGTPGFLPAQLPVYKPELMPNLELVRKALAKLIDHRSLEGFDDAWLPEYRQHNPGIPNGSLALKRYFTMLRPKELAYEFGLFAVDKNIVAIHSVVTGFLFGGKEVVLDFFRIEGQRIVEHWDVSQNYVDIKNSASGNPMFSQISVDTTYDETLLNAKAQARKALTALYERASKRSLQEFWHTDLIQHDPEIENGLEGLAEYSQSLNPQGIYELGFHMSYANLVISQGRWCTSQDKPLIVCDILRLVEGKVAEHWRISQQEVPPELSVNGNAMFPIRA